MMKTIRRWKKTYLTYIISYFWTTNSHSTLSVFRLFFVYCLKVTRECRRVHLSESRSINIQHQSILIHEHSKYTYRLRIVFRARYYAHTTLVLLNINRTAYYVISRWLDRKRRETMKNDSCTKRISTKQLLHARIHNVYTNNSIQMTRR